MDTTISSILSGTNIYTMIAIVLWTLPWKMWALWLSARRGDIWWFLPMTFLNTFAILEIVYIFFIAKQNDRRENVADQTSSDDMP
ncbi:MAG: hypothetical protein KBD24_04420 [Candidatus Pacebacteria bacterium]|nr:hypothetical protein [Candidatus Paceibacterota bacterium]